MRRTAFRLVPLLLLLASSPVLGADTAEGPDPRAAFAETDANRDARIDREEFHHRMVEIFFHGDTDKDGYMTREELVASVVFPGDFADADRDADNRISLYEFVRVRFATFDDVDADGDGVLSVEEVVATYEAKK